ncbi:MAG: hypothetical protein J6J37_08950 [Bacteroidaceae bacterium]|nr:hypothetical protein [Bacteroidaceae bacterium]
MNKIYQEPINKAESLIVGVKKCADSLAKKGIVINVDALSNACRVLEDAGAAQDAAEVKLKEARETAHRCLDELKEIFNASKAPIKQNYSPEAWASFGITDKK